jgi:hypothetical protein
MGIVRKMIFGKSCDFPLISHCFSACILAQDFVGFPCVFPVIFHMFSKWTFLGRERFERAVMAIASNTRLIKVD